MDFLPRGPEFSIFRLTVTTSVAFFSAFFDPDDNRRTAVGTLNERCLSVGSSITLRKHRRRNKTQSMNGIAIIRLHANQATLLSLFHPWGVSDEAGIVDWACAFAPPLHHGGWKRRHRW